MAKVEISFKMNHAQAANLLRGPELEAHLMERGERIAAAANAYNLALHVKRPGADDLEQVAHGVVAASEPSKPTGRRPRGSERVRVRTATYQAMEDQLHHQTLQRALDAGR